MAVEPFVLTSRITPPKPRDIFIRRGELESRLSGFLKPPPSLILVIAPSGYGKTSLVSSWLSEKHGCAWLALGNTDEVFISFIRYLNAAVRRVFPDFGEFIDSVSKSPINRSPGYFAEIFAFEIEKLESELILVLDNYHEVSDPKTLEFISILLDNMPLNLCLIIIAQEDPAFSVSKRRLSQRINELRGADLAFSNGEIREALSRQNGISVPNGYVDKIESKTEGWPAAVSLCAQALGGLSAEDQLKTIDDSLSSYRYIIDYFADWIVADIDRNTLDFIIDTAILESFTPALADFARDRADSEEIIIKLKNRHIPFFIQETDRQWNRYHRLFSEYVNSRYKNPRKSEICRRASLWFEEKGGAIQQAIRYALLSDDSPRVEELAVKNAEDLFITGKFEIVGKLTGELDGTIPANPALLRLRLWADYLAGSRFPIEDIITSSSASDPPARDFSLLCLKAWALFEEDSGAGLELARLAYDGLRNSRSFYFYMAALIYGRYLIYSGGHDKAVDLLSELETEPMLKKLPFIYCLLINYLMKALEAAGEPEKALQKGKSALSGASHEDSGVPEEGLILSETALLYLKLGDDIRAAECAEKALPLLSLLKVANFIPAEEIISLRKIAAGMPEPDRASPPLRVEKLSSRENDIMSLVQQGLSNKEIGEKLFISTGTVKWHLNNIFGKLDVSSRTQAILRTERPEFRKPHPKN